MKNKIISQTAIDRYNEVCDQLNVYGLENILSQDKVVKEEAMKDIKFRAWDKENEKMVDVIDFSCMNYPDIYKVMQYTGLKDKNKIEGYFSDIVKFQFTTSKCYGNPTTIDLVGEIKENSHCHSCIMVKSKEYNIDNIFNGEIIGNIYENPEIKKNKLLSDIEELEAIKEYITVDSWIETLDRAITLVKTHKQEMDKMEAYYQERSDIL